MKQALAWITLAGLLTAGAAAMAQQNSRGAATEDPQRLVLENGAIMYLELSRTIDAKKAKPGDVVSATLLAHVLTLGKISLRAGCKLMGHVTEAQAYTKDNPDSRLGIIFDKVIPKSGHEMAFNSVLLAVRPAPRLQIDSSLGPAPPRTSSSQPDPHYPMPRPAGAPLPASSGDQGTKPDRDAITRGGADFGATEVEGMSLEPSADGANRIVVSFKRTVKLESGMRLELRVTDGGPAKRDEPHAP